MALTKEKKASIVSKLDDILKNAESAVFVHFKGISVADTNEMRATLRDRSVGYTVTKKTLLKRALETLAPQGELPEIPGEVALAYGTDPVIPASSIAEFVKKHSEKLAILGGIFEGRYMSRAEMQAVASIPPTPVLRGMFVNVINSPIAGLAVALNAIAETKASHA